MYIRIARTGIQYSAGSTIFGTHFRGIFLQPGYQHSWIDSTVGNQSHQQKQSCFATRLGVSKRLCEPLWCLLSRVLKKVADENEKATLVVTTPLSPAQPWFLLLLHMSIDVLRCLSLNCLRPTANCSPPTLAHRNPLRLVT